MAKAVREISFHCRKCGSSGSAVWENLAPSDLSGERRLVSLSEGFYQRAMLGVALPEIICDHCGTGQSDDFPAMVSHHPVWTA